jgi:hypothetical protein
MVRSHPGKECLPTKNEPRTGSVSDEGLRLQVTSSRSAKFSGPCLVPLTGLGHRFGH